MGAMSAADRFCCTHLQGEGIGSVYERVVLGRLFRRLTDSYGYTSVVEYGCPITKGYDNLNFLERGIPATAADGDIDRIRQAWQQSQTPAFTTLEAAPPADLVWNFARVQQEPRLLQAMKALARKHVLVFVPNIFNVGTPFHLAYHLLTGAACRHAEQGNLASRTRWGLERLLKSSGLEVVESGYVDAPPLPNISFSIRELKETMGWAQRNGGSQSAPANPDAVWGRVELMKRFEDSSLISPLLPVVAHHIYALGRPR